MARRGKKTKGEKEKTGPPTIVNRKARHDYHILETVEAGIVLIGAEVKSLREGKMNLAESYARVKRGEVWLVGANISPYAAMNTFQVYEPTRDRKLLLHKRQIKKLEAASREKGLTIVPLKVYFKRGRAKLELGIAKGKKLYDKRETLKRRTAQREMDRAMKR
ncbi:MAG: SsrA-binding protein SmpB [Candidatus Nitrospinota bacterium M3_3B_026]